MSLPAIFTAVSSEEISLPSGDIVQVPKARPMFKRWSGAPVAATYGSKAILDFDGKPAFAELVILRVFQRVDWQGVWVDTFGGKYRTEFWPKDEVALPEAQQELLQNVYTLAGSTKGCWDVFCWQDDRIIFAESKRQAHDKIRDTQRQWLQAALEHGLPLTSFLVVEWSVAE